jgi:hypothetical protein
LLLLLLLLLLLYSSNRRRLPLQHLLPLRLQLLQLRNSRLHQSCCSAVEPHHDLPHIVLRHRPTAEAVMPVPARPDSSSSSSKSQSNNREL